MARRRIPSAPIRPVEPSAPAEAPPPKAGFWTGPRVALAVVLLLGIHAALAVDSLRKENPTVDEVAHLPAGVSYWQRGTFKLYHHNPPLVKLIAALPVIAARPTTAPLYETSAWSTESQASFAEKFALLNIPTYFELFDRARSLMPLFSILGGLAVFAWSRSLFGAGGGLLSLALWAFCPNILANARLVTSDVAAASIGVGATYLFWRYQHRPTWRRAALVGLALGLAQLTKFSMVLLYGLWPALAVVRFLLERRWAGWTRRLAVGSAQGAAMVALSVAVIDCGYGFEGVGQPLGRFEFASRSLTRPVPPGMARPSSPNDLLRKAWQYRVNRFRGSALGNLPVPLPKHYVLGFDEQKVETEGIPRYFFDPGAPRDDSVQSGYTVYLDGQLRRSGWWYYYLATLAYKVPEGTWALVILSGVLLVTSRRSGSPWADEVAVLAIPVGILGAMSFLTDICLGIRYILPIFPFVFVGAGRIGPWLGGLSGRGRWAASAVVVASLAADAAAVATIHPHYLAYFNRVSGGPGRGSEHLIDSNLDWGQDLVGLSRWLRENRPGQRVGLAYFGQVNPSILRFRGEAFDWFLPPAIPGTVSPMPGVDPMRRAGPADRLEPGIYAVSASIVRGLPWRLHDPASLRTPGPAWSASWDAREDAFGYFRELTPVAKVGYSISVYDVTADDCARLAGHWPVARSGKPAR